MDRLQKGEVMALISDAGTPGISDPGFLLVREALKHNLKVDCLPGATALIPALIKSGFPTDRFVFERFLPHKKGKQTLLKKLAEEDRTVIFYESPHRLVKTLEQVKEFFGSDRQTSVSRELSKKFEETKTGTVEDLITYFTSKEVKGEIVVVVSGRTKQKHNADQDV
jgi:16S rRNA (cytidine1402-2'-O)-methyltransferase